MSSPAFHKLEEKIDSALEVIELLRLQIEEMEDKNKALQTDNTALKNRQSQWEQNLAALLRKLEGADLNPGKMESSKIELYEKEEAIA